MAVRVKVKLFLSGRGVETTAIANTGFETSACEVLVPEKLAMAKWLASLKSAETQRFESPAGFALLKVLGEGKIQVICRDKKSKEVRATFISSPHEREVLLNDRLLETLEIEIIRPASGIWRFRTDAANNMRPSENPITY